MIARLAARRGIYSYNLVRGSHNVGGMEGLPEFKDTGLMTVINTDAHTFEDRLKSSISRNISPLVAFDAIGGKLSNTLFHSLRRGGRLYHYGSLSLKPMLIHFDLDYVFESKSVRNMILK